MFESRRWRWPAVLLVPMLVLAACGGRDGPGQAGSDEPGITDTSVKLGGIYPFSGNASAYAVISKGVEAEFRKVNEAGGVKMGDGNTRTIEFVVRDDGYTPARTVEESKRLVEFEDVFGLFNTLGTPGNSAIWDYMNQREVPQLFVATGATKWGADIDEHPWTIGWQPAYSTEAAIYAEYLKQERPDAKVAVLYQNDDYGQDYLSAFKRAIEGSGVQIVAEESYDVSAPTVYSQVTNLAQSGADVFFNVSTPKFAAQAIKRKAEIGWQAEQLLNSVSASISSVLTPAGLPESTGIVSAQYLKEPSDPQWATDPAMQEYRDTIARYGAGANPDDPFSIFGVAVAKTMIRTLEQAEEPTREAVLDSARSLDFEEALLLPGVAVKTTSDDGFPIEGMRLARFNGQRYELFGGVIDYEGRTPHPNET